MQTPFPLHPHLRIGLDIAGALADLAEMGAKGAVKALRPRRRGAFKTRRPGADSPLWNQLVLVLRAELKPYGAKVRLARYLGVPKQRLTDFLTGRRRLPDAELTLQLLNWLAHKRTGRDLSI